MKNASLPKFAPAIALCAGILGCALQMLFLSSATDAKGLLLTGHWADTASWILTALVLAALGMCAWNLDGIPKYTRLFPASAAGAAGNLAGALGIAAASIRALLSAPAALSTVSAVLGLAAAACLGVIAYYRWKGARPATVLRLPIIAFFLINALQQYRGWSAATQLQEYAFPALAAITLLLACYQRAALELRMNGRKGYVFFSLSAAYFCCLAIPGDILFYLPLAVWMLADCCSLKAMKKREPPESKGE